MFCVYILLRKFVASNSDLNDKRYEQFRLTLKTSTTVERLLIVIDKSELEATNFRSSMHAKQKLEDTSVGTLTIETISDGF